MSVCSQALVLSSFLLCSPFPLDPCRFSECCATKLLFAQCSHTAVARVPHHPQSQMGGDFGVSGIYKNPPVIAHDHLPIAGGPTSLPNPGDKIIYCTSGKPFQGCYILFVWYWSVLRKGCSRDISPTALSQPRMLRHQSPRQLLTSPSEVHKCSGHARILSSSQKSPAACHKHSQPYASILPFDRFDPWVSLWGCPMIKAKGAQLL